MAQKAIIGSTTRLKAGHVSVSCQLASRPTHTGDDALIEVSELLEGADGQVDGVVMRTRRTGVLNGDVDGASVCRVRDPNSLAAQPGSLACPAIPSSVCGKSQ